MTSGSGGRRVDGKVLMLDRSLEDTLPYLFALLGIEDSPQPVSSRWTHRFAAGGRLRPSRNCS